MQLERDDLIEGLRDLVRAVQERQLSHFSIRIVGGAALRLAHFDRDTTADIDARIHPIEPLLPIVAEIATARGWPHDWLNNSAAIFIPNLGHEIHWEPVFDDDSISVAIAPVDALLAMKLAAARPGRDPDDIAKLLSLNGIGTVAAAEELYENFYPGDALPDRTIALLDRIFSVGLPPAPPRPEKPRLN
ncbi:hypothetical protein [Salinibacterium sp. SWN167]|uniref:hypothetical protein n=1 Tax=Salinibacterium sp. SWN167 TaxID=2792054 RepID=UPI0018CEA882|nr:hypothetical protein [Salinibacterium sp. SWN167]MBH0082751.1 hypothetical protein [Salinibacterium sp. SWN167]